jgi:hypothetical protein
MPMASFMLLLILNKGVPMKRKKMKKTHAEALLDQGSNNRGVSGGAGGFQFGRGSNTPGRGSSIENQGRRNGISRGDETPKIKKSKNSSEGTIHNSLRGSDGGTDGFKSNKGKMQNKKITGIKKKSGSI